MQSGKCKPQGGTGVDKHPPAMDKRMHTYNHVYTCSWLSVYICMHSYNVFVFSLSLSRSLSLSIYIQKYKHVHMFSYFSLSLSLFACNIHIYI